MLSEETSLMRLSLERKEIFRILGKSKRELMSLDGRLN